MTHLYWPYLTSTTPVLALPDFNQPFIIDTDAYYNGIEAVLMQNRRPLAYISQGLGPKNMGLSINEKELLALVTAVSKGGITWRVSTSSLTLIIRA